MVVHCSKNGKEPEIEDMYDTTIYNNNAVESSEEVQDDAHNDIIAEIKFFAENQDKLNQNSNAFDFELFEKYKRAQFLGQRLRIINRQWTRLTDKEEHYTQQEAIKLEVLKM